MSLTADIQLLRGKLQIAAKLEVPRAETLALIGPNGAGKSTLLHAIAGLLRIQQGRIAFDGTTWDAGDARTFVEPELRGIGFVFQDHRLFPHLDARDNVAFSLRARGVPMASARATAEAWLQRVGLRGHERALPSQLSGGQSQRVALARALASKPRMLLLDEPLAAVDASLRTELRSDLRAHLDAFEGPRIVVTHDPIDAFALADRVAVIEDGRNVQEGPPAAISAAPRSRYAADFVGLNLLRGNCSAGVVALDGGGELKVAWTGNGRVFLTVHPRAIALFLERPSGSPRNVWQANVASIEPALDGLRVRFGGAIPLVAEITEGARQELSLRPGAPVWIALKATEIAVSPA
jgi:molybdate transport system ATP-binding protein